MASGRCPRPTWTGCSVADLEQMSRLLEFLVNQGADACQQVFAADSCIASTNVALTVFDYFEVGAYAKQVKTAVWRLDNSYALAIEGTGTHSEKKWDGHLVCIVPVGDDQYLLDMTSAQFSRPEHGLVVPPACVMQLPDDWDSFSTESKVSYAIKGEPEVGIQYQVIDADETGWRSSGDWSDTYGGVKAVAGLIVRAFREKEHGHDIEWDINIDHQRHVIERLGFRIREHA